MKDNITERRLLKLADHLESGKLEHQKFNFACWNADPSGEQLLNNGCGYSGCALGECPRAFPRDWQWKKGFPLLRKGRHTASSWGVRRSGRMFFGLSDVAFDHLFLPGQQCTELYGGRKLGDKTAAKSVARNMRAFVKKMGNCTNP